jgi:carbamoyl-phosphate synthase large subunit
MSGDIAESIALILVKNVSVVQIFGSDVRPEMINSNLCTEIFKSPPAENPKYYQWLTKVLADNTFKFFIPCSENELFALSNLSDTQIENINRLTTIVWAGRSVIRRLASKSKTHNFLTSINLHPPKLFSEDGSLVNFPVVVKPDIGRGSKNIFVCNNIAQVKAALLFVDDPIIQEYIPDLDHEYTCAVFRNLKFETVCIVFRRFLSGGVTSWAEIVNDIAIKNICVRIADELDLNGSINIQLRKSLNRIAIFEINPRFSSTVFMRSLVNFNDLLWSLGIGNPTKDYSEEKNYGVKFKIIKTADRIN